MEIPAPSFLDWGRTRHADATARQLALVEERLAGKAGDTLVFTEHEPVYTLGLRAGAAAHLLWDDAERARRGIGLEQTGRGGDITYHGPGQIVGYPIVSLAQSRDLHAYLRFLEQVVIDALAELGLAGTRRDGLTGIWIGPRKIAAIGVAARRWVTYHGFALNLDPDLTPFSGIVPCGIPSAQGTVTSVAAELGRAPEAAKVKGLLADAFWRGLPGVAAAR
jgi:lipoyl(octanoyl) transferase